MRSLQSMLIAASTLEHFFKVVSEGDVLYMGKNPRDAFQEMRGLEEVTLSLVSDGMSTIESAFILPLEDDYMADCSCNGFFDKWSA